MCVGTATSALGFVRLASHSSPWRASSEARSSIWLSSMDESTASVAKPKAQTAAVPSPKVAGASARPVTATTACSPPARQLLEALSVLRQPSLVGEVAALAELDDPLPAVDELAALGLVEEAP